MIPGGLQLGGELYSNLPSPRTDQILKTLYSTAAAGTYTLYTVPAGKRVYVNQISVSSAHVLGYTTLQKAATILTYVNAIADSTEGLTFVTPIQYDAGDTIVVSYTGCISVIVNGWEENA